MEFTVERSAFLKALSHSQSVVEKRNTVPILSHVLLSAKGGQLDLTATDLDLSIVESIPADVQVEGATTAPAGTLYEIVRKLADADIHLHLDLETQVLYVRAGRSEFKLSCLAPDDFPRITPGELPHRFRIASQDFKKLLDSTFFAMSTEEARYYLNGIYLHTLTPAGAEGAVLRAVASDGHRLALAEVPVPAGAENMPGIILGRKAVGEIRHLLEGQTTDLEVSLSDMQIRFSLPQLEVSSRLIDGTFPDYTAVIPQNNSRTLVVKTKNFSDSVSRVSTILTEKHKAIKLKIDQSTLELSAINPDCGNAVDAVEVDSDVEGLEIGFNARYLTDITHQIAGDELVMRLDSMTSPTIFQDQNHPGSLYVLMPLRV